MGKNGKSIKGSCEQWCYRNSDNAGESYQGPKECVEAAGTGVIWAADGRKATDTTQQTSAIAHCAWWAHYWQAKAPGFSMDPGGRKQTTCSSKNSFNPLNDNKNKAFAKTLKSTCQIGQGSQALLNQNIDDPRAVSTKKERAPSTRGFFSGQSFGSGFLENHVEA